MAYIVMRNNYGMELDRQTCAPNHAKQKMIEMIREVGFLSDGDKFEYEDEDRNS